MGQLVAVRSFVAEAAISANRVVTFGATDDNVLTAVAVTSTLIGIVEGVSPVLGERVDVTMTGIADLQIGAGVTRGAYITVDAQGRGVAAAPAAGVNNNVIGVALQSGVSGDIIPVLISPGRIQG
jgi:hypothetical protein